MTYLLGSYDYMMSSGEISVWEDKADPNCQVCVTFLQNAEQLAAQDGYLVGGAFDVHSTSFEGTGGPSATGTVTADFTQAESVPVDDPTLQSNTLEAVGGQHIAMVAWAGERQLVALARAYLADPDVIVLDEATSAVDPAADVRLQQAIDGLARGRTTITIAHRLSTAERADQILVLDHGHLVEHGTHAELVQLDDGIYAGLHRSWVAHRSER